MLPVTVLGVASVYGTARILRTRFWPAALDKRVARLPLMRRYWTTESGRSLIAGPATTIGAAYHRYDRACAPPVDQGTLSPRRARLSSGADAGHRDHQRPRSSILRTAGSGSYASGMLLFEKVQAADFTYSQRSTDALADRQRAATDQARRPTAHEDRLSSSTTAERAVAATARRSSLLDRGGILVVQFARMPKLDCLSAARHAGRPVTRIGLSALGAGIISGRQRSIAISISRSSALRRSHARQCSAAAPWPRNRSCRHIRRSPPMRKGLERGDQAGTSSITDVQPCTVWPDKPGR